MITTLFRNSSSYFDALTTCDVITSYGGRVTPVGCHFLRFREWESIQACSGTPPLKAPLTCLRRGNVDHDGPSRGGTQIRDPVLALHGEAVVGVRLQVRDLDRRRREAVLPGDVMHAAATGGALAAFPGALPAVNAVGDVSSAPRVPGRGPLQGDAGLVHRRNGVLWRRRGT